MKSLQKLFEDERGIEGMPIRLVIALVVGMATLAIMMQMLGTLSPPEQTEVDVVLSGSDVVGTDSTNSGTDYNTTIQVVDDNGQVVPNARVLISPDTAQLADTSVISAGPTNSDGEVEIEFGGAHSAVDLSAEQVKGALTVEIHPPGDSSYEDNQQNTQIIVIEGSA